jgi:hypothetical protein
MVQALAVACAAVVDPGPHPGDDLVRRISAQGRQLDVAVVGDRMACTRVAGLGARDAADRVGRPPLADHAPAQRADSLRAGDGDRDRRHHRQLPAQWLVRSDGDEAAAARVLADRTPQGRILRADHLQRCVDRRSGDLVAAPVSRGRARQESARGAARVGTARCAQAPAASALPVQHAQRDHCADAQRRRRERDPHARRASASCCGDH